MAGRAESRGANQRILGFLPKSDTTNFENTQTVSIYAPRRFQVSSKTLTKAKKDHFFSHCSLSAGEQASLQSLIHKPCRSADLSLSPCYLAQAFSSTRHYHSKVPRCQNPQNPQPAEKTAQRTRPLN